LKKLKSAEENTIHHAQTLSSSSGEEIDYNVNYGTDEEAVDISQSS
jgi:hypothetical protein